MKKNSIDNIKQTKKLLGKRIRELRKSKKMSIEKLAEKANLHTTYVGDIERGDANATISALVKIATALEVELYDLFVFSPLVTKESLLERFKILIEDENNISALNNLKWFIKKLME